MHAPAPFTVYYHALQARDAQGAAVMFRQLMMACVIQRALFCWRAASMDAAQGDAAQGEDDFFACLPTIEKLLTGMYTALSAKKDEGTTTKSKDDAPNLSSESEKVLQHFFYVFGRFFWIFPRFPPKCPLQRTFWDVRRPCERPGTFSRVSHRCEDRIGW